MNVNDKKIEVKAADAYGDINPEIVGVRPATKEEETHGHANH
jgi:FKBP-type peptidyl-prolyl cis-trans isomerase 2